MAMTLEQQQQLLTYTLKENIMLQARLLALERMFLSEISESKGQSPSISAAQYKKDVRQAADELIALHPLLDQTWKNWMVENLGDIPGIDL